MFVVLNVISSGKKRIKKGKTVESINEVKTGGGDRFYVVDILDSGTGIDWNEVATFIGKHSTKVLLDDKIGLPKECAIKKYNSERFLNLLMYNTLNIILKEMYLSGFRTKCYINDSRGDYAGKLAGIVQYSAETVVITKNEYRYFSQIQALYDNMGAGISLTDKTVQPESHAFIIDADGTFDYKGKGILFSTEKGIMPGNIDGFDDLKRLCPDYIDVSDFLAAVYEFNRERRLGYAFCSSMKQNSEEISVYELAQELKLRISASPDRRKSIIFYV